MASTIGISTGGEVPGQTVVPLLIPGFRDAYGDALRDAYGDALVVAMLLEGDLLSGSRPSRFVMDEDVRTATPGLRS